MDQKFNNNYKYEARKINDQKEKLQDSINTIKNLCGTKRT